MLAVIESMPFAEAITRALHAAEMDQSALARLVGVSSQAVNQWCRGETQPRGKRLEKIAQVLGVPVASLLGHDSEPPRPGNNSEVISSKDGIADLIIKEVDIAAGAGNPTYADPYNEVTAEKWVIPRKFLSSFVKDTENLRIISVSGESMSPEYKHGDKVLVDISHKTPSPPGVYVVWDGYGVVIKRLEALAGKNPPSIRLSSANTLYADYECSAEDLIVFGKVVGRWDWI